jgi:membrane associated rhomboid family serine protease
MESGCIEPYWYVWYRDRARGPFSRAEMIHLRQIGKVSGSTLVSESGRDCWRRLDSDQALSASATAYTDAKPSQDGSKPASEAEPIKADQSRRYFCKCDGTTIGPLTSKEVRTLARNGRLKGEDLVWENGIPPKVAHTIKGLEFARSTDQGRSQESMGRFDPLVGRNDSQHIQTRSTRPPKVSAKSSRHARDIEIQIAYFRAAKTPPSLVMKVLGWTSATISPTESRIEIRPPLVWSRTVTFKRVDPIRIDLSSLELTEVRPNGNVVVASSAGRFGAKHYIEFSSVAFQSLLATSPAESVLRSPHVSAAVDESKFQTGLDQIPTPAAWTLVALFGLTFLAQALHAGTWVMDSAALQGHGATHIHSILNGEWYRLVVSGFLSPDIKSLVANVTFLLLVGRFCERLIGTRELVVLLLAALVGSNWGIALWDRQFGLIRYGPTGMLTALIGVQAAAAILGAVPKSLSAKFFWFAACYLGISSLFQWATLQRLGIDAGAIQALVPLGELIGLAIGFAVSLICMLFVRKRAARGTLLLTVGLSICCLAIIAIVSIPFARSQAATAAVSSSAASPDSTGPSRTDAPSLTVAFPLEKGWTFIRPSPSGLRVSPSGAHLAPDLVDFIAQVERNAPEGGQLELVAVAQSESVDSPQNIVLITRYGYLLDTQQRDLCDFSKQELIQTLELLAGPVLQFEKRRLDDSRACLLRWSVRNETSSEELRFLTIAEGLTFVFECTTLDRREAINLGAFDKLLRRLRVVSIR